MAKSLAQRTSYAGRASRRHMALVTLAGPTVANTTQPNSVCHRYLPTSPSTPVDITFDGRGRRAFVPHSCI